MTATDTEDDFEAANITVGDFVLDFTVTSEYAKTVSVKYVSGSGDLTIPEEVDIGGVQYKVESIPESAFSYCTGLTSITIPSVSSMAAWAFSGCTELTSVTLSEGTTSIGTGAFGGCVKLSSFTAPNSVTSVNSQAFSGCTGLTSVSLPSVEVIGPTAFGRCAITSVSLPSIVTIGNNAFASCTELTTLALPSSVATIGTSVFSGCTKLASITVDSSNVNFISKDGILFTNDETTLIAYPPGKAGAYTIPNSVTLVDYVLNNCIGLTSITVAADHPKYYSEDGVLFSKDKAKLIVYPGGKTGAYTVPGFASSIEENAFSGSKWLTSLNTSSVTSIEARALNGSGLTSIIMPSVTIIGNYALSGCVELTSITMPSVISILDYAFQGCTGLTTFTIPSSMTGWGIGIFLGCTGIVSVSVDESNMTYASIDGVVFSKNLKKLVLYPAGRTGNYVVPDGVEVIGERAFYSSVGLTSITMPSVTYFEGYAFTQSASLTSITMPLVTSIGVHAFSNCEKLTSVVAPSLENVGSYAFYNSPNVVVTVGPDSSADFGSTELTGKVIRYSGVPMSTSLEGGVMTLTFIPGGGNIVDAVTVTSEGESLTVNGTGNVRTFVADGSEFIVTATTIPGGDGKGGNTMLYVGIGAVIVIILIIVVMLIKRH